MSRYRVCDANTDPISLRISATMHKRQNTARLIFFGIDGRTGSVLSSADILNTHQCDTTYGEHNLTHCKPERLIHLHSSSTQQFERACNLLEACIPQLGDRPRILSPINQRHNNYHFASLDYLTVKPEQSSNTETTEITTQHAPIATKYTNNIGRTSQASTVSPQPVPARVNPANTNLATGVSDTRFLLQCLQARAVSSTAWPQNGHSFMHCPDNYCPSQQKQVRPRANQSHALDARFFSTDRR